MIWFTADLHFGCTKLVENTRPEFATIEEHDTYILTQINSSVGRKDRLIICGDFCRNNPQKYRQRIKCKNVWLILGNHDKPSWGKHFSECFLGRMIKLTHGFEVWASHYPHAYYSKSHYGAGHVYGHCHSQREDTLDAIWPERRSIDIGVDNARKLLGDYRPFDEHWIHGWMLAVSGHDDVEFYRQLEGVRYDVCDN